MSSFFIGIDSGTQSTKAVVMQAGNGRVRSVASQSYPLIPGLPPGHLEQDPSVWIRAVTFTVRKAISLSGIQGSQIAGIGVSGQQHGFVPLDKNGRVIRPAKLWCDTSTAQQCEILEKRLGGKKRLIQLTGNTVPPGFTASKILWLKQKEPKKFTRLKTILLPHDYINFWLTGNCCMEYGDASGTGLLDVRRRQWQSKVLQAIDTDLIQLLPSLHSSELPAGKLSSLAARQLGLRPGILISAGGGDNMMGAIGTGNTKSGMVTASFGTSGTIYAYSSKPLIDPEGEIAAFCDSTGGWLPLLCTMNVTVATEMIRTMFKWSHEELTRQISKIPAGSHGLLFIPYLNGERTPNVPHGTGVFFGLRPNLNQPAILARSVMEGVTLGMNYGLNRLRQLGIRPKQIRITGGGAKSRVWRQIMANVFGCEVVGMKTAEGAAYGAALQAWWCHANQHRRSMSMFDLTDQIVKTESQTLAVPRREAVQLYTELQNLQNHTAGDLKDSFEIHHNLSSSGKAYRRSHR